MNRREALAGIASLGVLGTGGVIATQGMPSLGAADDPSESEENASGDSGGLFSNGGGSDTAQLAEPVEVETLALPWSDGEPMTVPIAGSVTVLEFFATWCNICARNLSDVTAAHQRVGDDVQFLSVTTENVGSQVTVDDVENWWGEHGGGEWPIGVDETARLPIRLDVPGVPATVIFDADGEAVWSHQGAVSTEKLLEKIEAAGGEIDEQNA